jgi:hypothetical protein
MKRMWKRIAAWSLLLWWLPAGALALTGQSVSTFETYYKDDITYLNDASGRHMLPKDLTALDLGDNGRTQYSYSDNVLQVTVAADAAGIIESCEIRLLYPEGAAEGNSLYLDFVTANYHSLAFLMAMHVSSEVSSRFLLVQEIATAMEQNSGTYDRQLGSYSVSCIKVTGEGAVFTFTNNGLQTAQPAETAQPADGGQDAPVQDEPADEEPLG